MSPILERIIKVVRGYYAKPNPVINWNDWIFHGHNEAVDYWVTRLAEKYKFDVEAVRIAAYLHDISYAWTSKNDPNQEPQAIEKAREILLFVGTNENRIKFIVDGIITGHGMHEGKEPKLLEAKIFSTADAMAHFTTDLYLVMDWNHYLFESKGSGEYRNWVVNKLERDFNKKIFFDDFREIARPYYEALKTVFELPPILTNKNNI